jgi:hypothetical protein
LQLTVALLPPTSLILVVMVKVPVDEYVWDPLTV